MPKFNTVETCLALAILGGVAGWLVFQDPTSSLLSMIVGGLLGALNLNNPQKRDPNP